MGDVIRFRPRKSSGLDPETRAMVRSILSAMDREAKRRIRMYGDSVETADALRVLSLYPMFRLTHSKRIRRCTICEHRIQPLELHFVKDGGYVCQSGTCMG